MLFLYAHVVINDACNVMLASQCIIYRVYYNQRISLRDSDDEVDATKIRWAPSNNGISIGNVPPTLT